MYYGTITLNCPFFSVIDIIDVWWSFTNEIYNVTITSTTDTTKYRGADVSNPAIRIYNIDETNVGFYSCHVTNSQGEGIGPPIEVLIVGAFLVILKYVFFSIHWLRRFKASV